MKIVFDMCGPTHCSVVSSGTADPERSLIAEGDMLINPKRALRGVSAGRVHLM